MPEEQLAETELQALNPLWPEPLPYVTFEMGTHRQVNPLDQLAAVWAANNVPAEELRKALDRATEAFDDRDTAMLWLQERNLRTGNRPPISILGTPKGLQTVEYVLGLIQYGIIG